MNHDGGNLMMHAQNELKSRSEMIDKQRYGPGRSRYTVE